MIIPAANATTSDAAFWPECEVVATPPLGQLSPSSTVWVPLGIEAAVTPVNVAVESVSPLVATESLFGVLFAVLLLRRSELVGRHVFVGAALIVAGAAVIGASR